MAKRSRLLAWLAGVVLLVGAVIVLRTPDPGGPDPAEPAPVIVERFAADLVVLPSAGSPPAQPERIVVAADSEQLRLYWAEGLTGGEPLPGVVGFEVRWERVDRKGEPGVRLVAAPDVQLDGLANGQRYRVQVRSVDGYGQRSSPTEVTGVPDHAAKPWLMGLTGLYDDFSDPSTISPDSPDARWHVSGYRGCVGLGAGRVDGRGLPIDLGCGADMAVLRARSPLRLRPTPGGELGRVAVRTDAAGPGGELTVDLVPGKADRVGVGVMRASRTEEVDPALPGGTIRVSISDGGTQVSTAPNASAARPTVEVHPAPRRGPGVTHLFEVVLTTSGVRVYQDGLAVASRGVLPTWQEASVLLGVRGPDGRRSRVHVSSAGFSGSQTPPAGVIEAPANLATQRILAPTEQEPGIGFARTPLTTAKTARVVATLAVNPELDPTQVVVQLGAQRVPAKPVVAVPPTAQGAALTVVADVPSSLLGPNGPPTITPFVLRAPGSNTTATVLETYLEITPAPNWQRPTPPAATPENPTPDAMPVVLPELGNAAGDPLSNRTVPQHGQLVLTVRLDAAAAQWDTGTVADVQGIQVRLDGALIAGVPTNADGPGVGGIYALPIALGGLDKGPHTIEVRQYGEDGKDRPQSALVNFTVS